MREQAKKIIRIFIIAITFSIFFSIITKINVILILFNGDVFSKKLEMLYYLMSLIMLILIKKIYYFKILEFQNRSLLLIIMSTFYCGWFGYVLENIDNLSLMLFVDSAYYSIQLFGLSVKSGTMENNFIFVAKFFAIFSICGIFINILAKRIVERFIVDIFYRNHIIIYCSKVTNEVINIIEAQKNIRVILFTEENTFLKYSYVRIVSQNIHSFFINHKSLIKAKRIFIFTDDPEKSIQTTYEVVNRFRKSKRKDGMSHCYVFIENESIRNLLYSDSLFNKNIQQLDVQILSYYSHIASEIINAVRPDKLVDFNNLRPHEKFDLYHDKVYLITGEGKLLFPFILEFIKQIAYSNIVVNRLILLNIQDEQINEIMQFIGEYIPIEITHMNSYDELDKLDFMYIVTDYDYQNYEFYQKILQFSIDKIAKGISLISLYGNSIKKSIKSSMMNKIHFMTASSIDYSDDAVEQLAEMIHIKYLGFSSSWLNNSSSSKWHELSENTRISNRYSAKHLCFLNSYYSSFYTNFTHHTLIEQMARREHERWLINKVFQGFIHSEKKCDVRRSNNLLRNWLTLTNEERQQNKDFMNAIHCEYMNIVEKSV